MKRNILCIFIGILISVVFYKIIFFMQSSTKIVENRQKMNKGIELSQEGYNYFELKQYQKAILTLQKSIELLQDNWRVYSVHNNLAWILSTCSNSQLRNGSLALYHAKLACENTDYKTWEYIDTLAAAYAECGDFENAVIWAEKAHILSEDINAKQRIERKLKLYKSKKAFHENEDGETGAGRS